MRGKSPFEGEMEIINCQVFVGVRRRTRDKWAVFVWQGNLLIFLYCPSPHSHSLTAPRPVALCHNISEFVDNTILRSTGRFERTTKSNCRE